MSRLGEGASRSSQIKTNNYDIGITNKLRIFMCV